MTGCPEWAVPLQPTLERHHLKKVKLHCGRYNCGIVLDELAVFEVGSRDIATFRIVGGQSAYSGFGKKSRPHIFHRPGLTYREDNQVEMWVCKCDATYRIGKQSLTELFLTAVEKRTDITLHA